VDSKGMTLYMFTKDTADKSNCAGGCLTAWPPLITSGTPVAGSGVDNSKLGAITLADGSMQVTYNHMPLYYFAKDKAAGDTFGQNVGSVWFLVAPDGTPITTAPAGSSTSTPAPTATTAAAAMATLNLGNTTALGSFLVDAKGMTLYVFTKDTADKSNCSGACLTAWPPLLTTGTPTVGTGVDDSKIGTITLADGTMQVTYNHMPLYYFAKDKAAGDTSGQNVGSVWFVVSADGKMITTAPAPAAATNTPSAAAGATVMLGNTSALGSFLVDAKGMTLYIFTKDTADKSNCSGACLTAWPPLLTTGTPVAGMGVDDSKLGSITLADGTRQVTYNHMPLYYYAKDKAAGDTLGQNVGSVWFVLSADGKEITTAP
jgi:predicted lipoprotein with Yx(FWY)xxD motif